MRLACRAPAKINRELRVGGLRPDGFHEIRSRMVSIDLSDRLWAEPGDSLELSCDDPAVPTGGQNLVVRAATLLAESAGIRPRARLRLEKRIPIGGGLGGGSADAAATLLLLTRLWGLAERAREREPLESLAARLGSDVPFFLTGGEVEVAGRGEVVTARDDGPPVDLLLLVPPFSISTAAVYRTYAGRGALPDSLEVDSLSFERFLGTNDLASAVLQVEPRMEAYLKSARRAAPDLAISGSGSAIVIRGATADAARALSESHPEARVIPCRTLSRAEFRRHTDPTGGVP